tara:strand:+ start:4457 stop:4813 length:357 start_codon:yes stop_codon:yes gene_type:complete
MMNITKTELKKLIREEVESMLGENRFEMPAGFTQVSKIAGHKDASFVLKSGGKPGLYSTNNGYIVAVDSNRTPYLWVPMSDASQRREVSFSDAINSLKSAGYREGDFNVPLSTGFSER